MSSEDRVTRIVWSRGSVAKRGPGYCSQGGYFRYRFWSTHDRKRSHLTTRETSVRGKKRFGKWRVITGAGAFPLPSVSFFQTLSPLHSLSVSLSLSFWETFHAPRLRNQFFAIFRHGTHGTRRTTSRRLAKNNCAQLEHNCIKFRAILENEIAYYSVIKKKTEKKDVSRGKFEKM